MQTDIISTPQASTAQVKSIPIKFERFQATDDADCQRRILAAREKLGKRLVILGHHY
ncbi:MAG: quinolinate synthase NadA, partial [Methylotenera sp.]